MKKNVLVTGGAGFIGSNLVEYLLKDPRVGIVRVLDNFATSNYNNIKNFETNPAFQFLEGDVRDYNVCLEACKDMQLISHQAALGSVPRSIKDPISSTTVNITGTVNVFTAARETGISRVVYAASSSKYGDSTGLPKSENTNGKLLSPYAITKYTMELFASVFGDLYDTEFIGLRYFNVFGPRQNPNGDFAAVIPLFFKAALSGKAATINGDGSHSRDFTYVQNVINANVLALFTQNEKAINEIFNVACGERTSLIELWDYICETVDADIIAVHGPERVGDIPHSLADISKGRNILSYIPEIDLKQGLQLSYKWYRDYFK
jgi:UDP-N-acetylglucosamine 4-epimerase